MRRAPIVITATVAGLAAVLEFHSRPASVSVATIPAAGSSPAASASPAQTGTPGASAQPSASPRASSSSAAGGTRTATGPLVNYNWGVLSVSVTVSGTKIVKVAIASLEDTGDPRSVSIDQQSIPILEQEAMSAQSANIQAVSGASYTSAGFTQSLQGALQQLGVS